MLPPGLFRLATRPTSTGSAPVLKTIGMVAVAALAASADATLPGVAITVTRLRARSAANSGSRAVSGWPACRRRQLQQLRAVLTRRPRPHISRSNPPPNDIRDADF